MDKIKVPTLFFYTEDDPIINRNCIEFEKAKRNDNILICSTNYGAHLCSYEHFFKIDQWIHKPAFEFLDYFKKNDISQPRANQIVFESDSESSNENKVLLDEEECVEI